MDKFDRIFQLHAILSTRRTPMPLEDLMARLECSRATLYRAVTARKDQLNAPIVYDADAGRFLYQRSAQADTYELPGLWFSATELQARPSARWPQPPCSESNCGSSITPAAPMR